MQLYQQYLQHKLTAYVPTFEAALRMYYPKDGKEATAALVRGATRLARAHTPLASMR